jgi:3D (Asp-Asp-Asp) domain-containing protein
VELAGRSTSVHVEVVLTARGAGTAEVLIRRAFPVAVQADGEKMTAQFVEGTVADLLHASDIELGPEDFVEPAPETPLKENLVVEVRRVDYSEETKREQLEPEVVDAYVATLDVGMADAFVESASATYDVTYRHKLVDGEVAEREIVEMIPMVQPRPADSHAIEEGVPCSRIEGFDDIETDISGLPVGYTRLMEDAVCASYSASRGSGASGLGLYCGTVAVNPEIIPYGTRLYVTSSDGTFVYGYCIATDTGTALMAGRIDLDLFFETDAECMRFGKRAMNVYILPDPPAENETGDAGA